MKIKEEGAGRKGRKTGRRREEEKEEEEEFQHSELEANELNT